MRSSRRELRRLRALLEIRTKQRDVAIATLQYASVANRGADLAIETLQARLKVAGLPTSYPVPEGAVGDLIESEMTLAAALGVDPAGFAAPVDTPGRGA